MNRWLPTLFLTAALFSLGCASLRAPETEEAAATPIPAGRLLVAPLNLGVSPPPGFDADPAPVWEALLGYLRTLDRQVAVLDPIGAERVWLEAIQDVEAEGEPVDLPSVSTAFARRVQEETDFAALVLPSVVARRARVTGHSARWDGVRRPVPVPAVLRAGAEANLGPSFSTRITGFSGAVVGASLHVALITPDGSVASEGMGGLDLLQMIDGESSFGNTTRWQLEPRPEPYADADHLREGIARAFEGPTGRSRGAWWPRVARAR